MTFRQKFERMLFERGLFPDQAREAVSIAASGNRALQACLDSACEGYPPEMLAVFWLIVKQATLEWIDENCPQAWFKPLFSGEQLPAEESGSRPAA